MGSDNSSGMVGNREGDRVMATETVDELDRLMVELRHLVSLNKPQNGGPYRGYAAERCVMAMTQSADAIDRLREENERLRNEVVFGFYEEEHPMFVQGYDKGVHELTSPVTAEECAGYVNLVRINKDRAEKAEKRLREAEG